MDIKAVREDIGPGVAIALLSLTYALSYGALLFTSPVLLPHIGLSISAALVTTIIAVIGIALLSRIRFAIAGPEANSVAVLASLVIFVSESLSMQGLQDEALALAVMSSIAVISAITGVTLYLLGRFKIGNFIRFIPISVSGGFLAAAGCLMASGAIVLATGLSPAGFLDAEAVNGLALGKLAAVVALAAIYWTLTARLKSTMALPTAILISIIAIHAWLAINGISVAEAQEMGLLLHVHSGEGIFFPPLDGNFDPIIFSTILQFAPALLATILVAALAALLLIAGIELDRNFDSDLNHELAAHGKVTVFTSFFGGFVGLIALSRTLLNAEKKSAFPVAAVCTALLCGVVLVFGSGMISLLPQIPLAATVLYLGGYIAWRWMGVTFKTLDRFEYALILVIAFTTLFAGFIFGLGLGIIAGCILFAARASLVSVVRQELSGEAYRSRVVRSADEETFLDASNQSIRIYELQGFLFFGTAYNFYKKIKAELEDKTQPIRHIVLSFKHVSGVDASAEQILQKIFFAADKYGAVVSTIELSVDEQIKIARLLRRSRRLMADQNYAAIYDAMEAIEENLLHERAFEGLGNALHVWLESCMADKKLAATLFAALEGADYAEGDVICRQGDPSDAIYFLDSGRIDVVSHDARGQSFRIYSYMRHTMLGEMGFVRRTTRSADLIARGPTRVFSLTRATYEQLEAAQDPCIDALLQLIAVTLSDRIISANRTIAELQA